jgi:hypothetical protein
MKRTTFIVILMFVSRWICAEQSSNLTPLIPRDEEVRLALSAGPEHLRKEASVFVLERGGYVRAQEGTNGFTCLVEHDHPLSVEPICFDAEGSMTTLPAVLEKTRLREQGLSDEEIAGRIKKDYESGKLQAPQKPGIAYMLSPELKFYHPETGKYSGFVPHVMFYVPYMKNQDIGALPKHFGSTTQPWVLNEGTPTAYVIVVPQLEDAKPVK